MNAELTKENSDRGKAEEALRASEERWRKLFENSSAGIALVTPDGRYTAANSAFQKMVGYTEEELLRLTVLDLTHEEDRVATEAILGGSAEGQRQDYRIETRYRRKDGSVIWADVSDVFVPASGGAAAFFAAVIVDISERKRAEEELRRSEGFLAEGQKISHTGSWVWNIATGKLVWSEEHRRIFGYDRDDLTFQLFLERLHPEDRSFVQRSLDEAVRERRGFNFEFRIALPNGIIKWLQGVGTPIVKESGEVDEYIGSCMDITDRKHAEEELQRSEAFLAQGQRISHTGSWGWQVATGTAYWSKETFRIFNCDPKTDRPSYSLYVERVHPEDRAWVEEVLNRAVRAKGNVEYEHRISLPDGSIKFVRNRGQPLVSPSGELEFIGTVMDITEGKRAEQELRYHMQLLKTVTDNASSALYIIDLEGRVTFVNPALERMTGYRAEELIGQLIHDMVHHTKPDGSPYPAHECPLARAVRHGCVLQGEDFFVRKDGTLFPVHYILGPVFRDGVVVGTFNEVQDLTESKAAEGELRKQAQLLALAHDAIIVRDSESRITFWNQGAVKKYGWTAEEAIGKISHELLQTRFPVSRQAVDIALLEHGEWEGELTHISRQGTAIIVTSRQSLRRDQHGGVETILEINRNITEKKQAEEALQKAQAELAHISRVTTMGELTASITHEISQPLAAVVTNADASLRWLSGDSPNLTEAREAIRRITRDGKRAGNVISRMRSLFKKAGTAKDRLDLNEVIEEVVILTETEARRDRVALRKELAADLPPVMGDRVQLQQVVVNLILNAIEAMATVDGRERDLVIKTQLGEGDEVRVAVRDSGIGFDPLSAERIFDAFHSTKPGGLGLGLSISRSMVESHGGRLWATSNDGPGVTFQFTLLRCQ